MLKKSNLQWGITIVLSACTILLFYDTFFQGGVLLLLIKRLLLILKPVLYGLAMAYLLLPVVGALDRRLAVCCKRKRLCRGLSILLAWLSVLLLLYLIFRILIPQLSASIATLVGNLNNYYATVSSWVNTLMDDYPEISQRLLNAFRNYYNELLDWITNKWLPQAQVALAAVTGGVVSILRFCKDMLVGLCVSVYVLACREQFASGGRRLLYALFSRRRYARILSELHTVDGIFSGFVRGKLLDSLLIGLICFAVCSILRFPYTPLISVIVGVTNVIPFFGPFLGAIPSAFLILLVDPMQCLSFVIFILILQQFDGNILGPRILGESTGLSGLWVIVAILVGGGFAGVLGMFLGVPVFACICAAIRVHSDDILRKKGITGETPTLEELRQDAADEKNKENLP